MNQKNVAKTLMRLAKMIAGDARPVNGTPRVRISKEQREEVAKQIRMRVAQTKEAAVYRQARIARTVQAEFDALLRTAAAPTGVVRAVPKLKSLFLKYQLKINPDGSVDIPYFTELGYPGLKTRHFEDMDKAVRSSKRISDNITEDMTKFTALLDQVSRAKRELETKAKLVDALESNKGISNKVRDKSIQEEIDGALATFDMHLAAFMNTRYVNEEKRALHRQLADMRQLVSEGDFRGAIGMWEPITERVEGMLDVWRNMLSGLTKRKTTIQSLINYAKREKSKHPNMTEQEILKALLGA